MKYYKLQDDGFHHIVKSDDYNPKAELFHGITVVTGFETIKIGDVDEYKTNKYYEIDYKEPERERVGTKYLKYDGPQGWYIVASENYDENNHNFSGVIVKENINDDFKVEGNFSNSFVVEDFRELLAVELMKELPHLFTVIEPKVRYLRYDNGRCNYVVASENYDENNHNFSGYVVETNGTDEDDMATGYFSNRFIVSSFTELTDEEIENINMANLDPIPMKDDIVFATRLKDGFKCQAKYFGRVEGTNKHVVDFNGTHGMIVDKVEVLPTLTKKEAKQKVSEIFANGAKKVTSQDVRDIIDRIA